MGIFDKKFFRNYVDSECQRQMLLCMARVIPACISPSHQIITRKDRFGMKSVTERGKIYEQEVYDKLIALPQTKYVLGKNSMVIPLKLDAFKLNTYYDEIKGEDCDYLVLLEAEIFIPDSFFSLITNLKPSTSKADNPLFAYLDTHSSISEKIRPDILIISKQTTLEENLVELMPDGTQKQLNKSESRLCISIIDIKITHPERVGKKQFIELIYYSLVLSDYLYTSNMSKFFYIGIKGHGIFPGQQIQNYTSIEAFYSEIIDLNWNETMRLFSHSMIILGNICSNIPMNINDTECHIQPLCGRCDFLYDCVSNLGFKNGIPNPSMDIQLIPYIANSTVQRLKQLGFRKLKQITESLAQFEIGDIPDPVYTELPLLLLKAEALSKNVTVLPDKRKISSVSIPKFSDMSLVFSLELDPLSQFVFLISFHLSIYVAKTPYKKNFDSWWVFWNSYLQEYAQNISPDVNKKKIQISQFKIFHKMFPDVSLDDYKSFSDLLVKLKNKGLSIKQIKDKSGNNKEKATLVELSSVVVNDDSTQLTEVKMFKEFLEDFQSLIHFCRLIERNIQSKNRNKTIIRPKLAIYHWSYEIIDHFRDLIVRTLPYLFNSKSFESDIWSIIFWFSSSETGFEDPLYHKKVFDLRLFVETTISYPIVINYTWHEIISFVKGKNIPLNRFYWSQHFNYMDFRVWYRYISETKEHKKLEYELEIKKQANIKLKVIQELRIHYQKTCNELISVEYFPVDNQRMQTNRLSHRFHFIAQSWYAFSRLVAAEQEFHSDFIRTIFPEHSIGKLIGAEVEKMQSTKSIGIRGGLGYYYQFELQGISSNSKINEGDVVILVPESLRDFGPLVKNWTIVISEKRWNFTNNCWDVKSNRRAGQNIIELAKNHHSYRNSDKWYLYPAFSDNWTYKLSYMLTKNKIGITWLGNLIAHRWGLLNKKSKMPRSEFTDYNSQEMYLFLPHLINNLYSETKNKESINKRSLISQICPIPDKSQTDAINMVNNSAISSILGPPGTGKTQTIVALMDEIIQHSGKPTRFLVVSFSYSALTVLAEKISKSTNTDGTPTKISNYKRIMFRSENREPISSKLGTDLFRKGHTLKMSDRVDNKGNREYFNVSISQSSHLDDYFDSGYIMLSNPHQLYNLHRPVIRTEKKRIIEVSPLENSNYDYIIIDEASQMPLDNFLACLLFLKSFKVRLNNKNLLENYSTIQSEVKSLTATNMFTKVILIGDHNQLPPVQPIKPPERLKPILGSLFQYYSSSLNKFSQQIPTTQLKVNYRSNADIVAFTRSIGLYTSLKAFNPNQSLEGDYEILSSPWNDILDPEKSMCTIIHDNTFDVALSELEASLCSVIAKKVYQVYKKLDNNDEVTFWSKFIGIVAPHVAHRSRIIKLIYLLFKNLSDLPKRELMFYISNSVYTVEKFQGSERAVIIASMGISSSDQIKIEEEFLFELTRFNVLTSRAKCKFILICSQNFLNYFPSDRYLLKNTSIIRNYALDFCNQTKEMISFTNPSDNSNHILQFRWHAI